MCWAPNWPARCISNFSRGAQIATRLSNCCIRRACLTSRAGPSGGAAPAGGPLSAEKFAHRRGPPGQRPVDGLSQSERVRQAAYRRLPAPPANAATSPADHNGICAWSAWTAAVLSARADVRRVGRRQRQKADPRALPWRRTFTHLCEGNEKEGGPPRLSA
jgi:hypothetical protein